MMLRSVVGAVAKHSASKSAGVALTGRRRLSRPDRLRIGSGAWMGGLSPSFLAEWSVAHVEGVGDVESSRQPPA